MRIVESLQMVDGPFEDWSAVRSPGRARRRRRQGHQQRIRLYFTPKKHALRTADGLLIMHPVAARTLRDALAAKVADIWADNHFTSPFSAGVLSLAVNREP